MIFQQNTRDKVRIYARVIPGVDRGSGKVVVESLQLNFVGFVEGDIILKINDQDVTPQNFDGLMYDISDISNTENAIFTVFRDGKTLELTGKPMLAIRNEKNVIDLDVNPNVGSSELKERFIEGCEFMITQLSQ